MSSGFSSTHGRTDPSEYASDVPDIDIRESIAPSDVASTHILDDDNELLLHELASSAAAASITGPSDSASRPKFDRNAFGALTDDEIR
jgi:hypothetical protein